MYGPADPREVIDAVAHSYATTMRAAIGHGPTPEARLRQLLRTPFLTSADKAWLIIHWGKAEW